MLHDSVEQAFKELGQETSLVTPVPPAPAQEEAKAAPQADPVEDTKPPSADYIEGVTDTAFAIIDNVQTTIFTIMANRRRKRRALEVDPENGVNRLLQLRAEKEGSTSSKNVEVVEHYKGTDAKLLHIDAVVDDYIASLPFTDKQIEMMRPGLRAMVEKNAGKIPPELLFYAGLATAIGGNIAEYYTL